jgi:Protein of unknown function (DUF2892)
MFANNIGTVDRILRIIVGVALLAAFLILPSTSSLHYFYLIGIVPLLTAVIGSCPLYSLFGISTCPMRKS